MQRKILKSMLKWKEKSANRSALLIEGARRVGKTYIALEFAKKYYKSFIYIDFNKASANIKDLFDNYLEDLDTLFLNLSAVYNTKLYDNDTLIIFDEVQLFPRARAALKFLVEHSKYHYLETGSLMSIHENVKNIVIPSEEHRIQMYPMDFEEFLWATNNELMIEAIKNNFENKLAMGQALHRKASNLFRQYLIVGGMPQAVAAFIENQDFEVVDEIKRNIIGLYKEDIGKHAKGYEQKVKSIFERIPDQLTKHEKKFALSSINKDAKFREYESSFLWLQESMICNVAYNSTEPNVGIKLNRDTNTHKIYMGDTGLLISHTFDDKSLKATNIYEKLIFGKLEINEGMFFENIVAQMLTSAGHKLYFYSTYSKEDKEDRMEIDFLINKRNITNRHNIQVIEVKSGKRYTYSSLRKFKKKYKNHINKNYIIHTSDYLEKDDIVYLPVYMTWLL